ncbi:hypothetical protein FRC17_000814 [Serendipita sp. 399]|nr:hypothetical protein FRC17_000814 [Serendipita sp. 399]
MTTTNLISTALVLFNVFHTALARGRGGGGHGGGGSSSTTEEEETQGHNCVETGECVAIGSLRIPKSYFIWGGVILGLLVLSCVCCTLWKCGVLAKLFSRARAARGSKKTAYATGLPHGSGGGADGGNAALLGHKAEYTTVSSIDQPYNPPYQIQQPYSTPQYSQSGRWTPDSLNKPAPLPYGQGGTGYATGPAQYQNNYDNAAYYQPPTGPPPRN